MDFAAFARQADEELDLVTGALLIAADAYPGLNLSAERSRLRELHLGAPAARVLRDAGAQEQAQALAAHIYGRLGFSGNEQSYYDPKNSFINEVITRRTGIPITLAVVYLEVARRAGVDAKGVPFPGHFLIRIDDASGTKVIVDPFHGGATIERPALTELWARATDATEDFPEAALQAASTRQVLVRMLMNLRAVYGSRGDYAALLVVLDRIVMLLPNSATDLRDRGLLSARLGAPQAALADLNAYLERAPAAGDVAEVRRMIERLGRLRPQPN